MGIQLPCGGSALRRYGEQGLNETHRAAKAANLLTGYKDAYPDLEAALQYVVSQYAPKQLIAWGSSYSASLVLILAAEHTDEIQQFCRFAGRVLPLSDQSVADFASKITQRCSYLR